MRPVARLSLGATLLAALFASIIVGIHRESPRTFVSAHGLLHSAVANRYLEGREAAFPPENPFFAGEALPYYWFFQWLGAGVSALLDVAVLQAFELMILAAVVLVFWLGASLGWRLFGAVAPGLMVGFLVLAGCHPQGPLLLLLRLWKDGGEVLFGADGSYLWGLVHPANAALRVADPFCMTGPLISFFLNVTARPMGLVSVLGVVVALERAMDRRSVWTFTGLTVAFALCGAFSSIVGLGLAAGVSAILLLLVVAHRRRGTRPQFHWPFLLAAIWTGVVLSALTFHHLFGAAGLELKTPGEAMRSMVAMGASVWLLLGMATIGTLSAMPDRRIFCLLLVLTALGLMGMAILTALPVSNQDNWTHAAIVLLAVPAAGFATPRARVPAWLRSQGRRVAFMVLAFVPTLTVVLYSYTGRDDVPLVARDGRLRRLPADSAEAQMYEWVRHATPLDAVFILDPDAEFVKSTGNTIELPALTARTIWTERSSHYMTTPYADGNRRVALAEMLTRGRRLASEESELLEPLRRDVFVVTDQSTDPEVWQRLVGHFDEPVFHQGALAVFRWRRP